MAAWQGHPAALLWQGQALEHPQGMARGPLLWGVVLGWFQSSQEWGHTAEVCSSFVAVLVPGYRQTAGQRALVSGQLMGMCSGENPGRSADQTSEQEVEDHHNGRALDPSVFHSEAVRRIPAEVGARRSGEEACTGNQGHHCMANGDRSPVSWQ